LISIFYPGDDPEISTYTSCIFGASDAALLDVVLAMDKPFSCPLQWRLQSKRCYDSKDPLYKFEFGLSY